MHFSTTTELQKHASEIATRKEPSIISRRGRPEGIIVPFFSGYEDFVTDYMEAYEMNKNREKLSKELAESKKSGVSSFFV